MRMMSQYRKIALGLGLAALVGFGVASSSRAGGDDQPTAQSNQPASLPDHAYAAPVPVGPAPSLNPPSLPPSRPLAVYPTPSYVHPASAMGRALPPSPTPTSRGLPMGNWSRQTPMGDLHLTVLGNQITIQMDGSGEFSSMSPNLKGEYSVASDGTIYGLIHSVDLGVKQSDMESMDEELFVLSGMSDIPFSMRIYAQNDVLAIKQVTFGVPMPLLMAADGDVSELTVYAQFLMTGQFSKQ